ncbi:MULTISPECIES: GlcG/HbpS family heme-binding protein [unclassified Streptomyces]|uniref:GlcG/HbpS family heme-binding protein n=1 Tax=unclassified Streptomyces TaxID=2593676 RepID=UPI002E303396|nr:heme-binding protein [Streptomyces sp. NBC_01361]
MRAPLSYAIAHAAAESALAAARTEGAAICAVVIDRSGGSKVLLADDGVGLIGIETARRKAYTAAVSGMATSAFAELAASPAMVVAPVHLLDDQLLPVPGGVPITVDDGEVIGAIGIGGADAATDDRLARQALKAIADLLA